MGDEREKRGDGKKQNKSLKKKKNRGGSIGPKPKNDRIRLFPTIDDEAGKKHLPFSENPIGEGGI